MQKFRLVFGSVGKLALMVLLVVVFVVGSVLVHAVLHPKVRGMRVNPAYFYPPEGKVDVRGTVQQVVKDAREAGVNALFVSVYSSVYGAFYPTDYEGTNVEHGVGRQDVLGVLLREARAAGLGVVASVPIDNFQSVWEQHPDWRSKGSDGQDYIPGEKIHKLSVWSEGYRTWYRGFLEDLLRRYPALDGVEAVEGRVDHQWKGEADRPANFAERFGSDMALFRLKRAEALTQLHGELAEIVRARHRKSLVVQTWAADANGELLASERIRDGAGFDFMGLSELPHRSRPDFIAGELIWQENKEKFPQGPFDPEWTRTAARTFVKNLSRRVRPLVHVELTPFGSVAPSLEDFRRSLTAALTYADGATFYDYHLAQKFNALPTVAQVYSHSIDARLQKFFRRTPNPFR